MKNIRFILFVFALCWAFNAIAQETQIKENIVPDEKSSSTLAPAGTQKNTQEEKALNNIDELKAKADGGDLEAQLDLGYMYLYGVNGTNIDYKQALTYYEMAAKQDSAVAYNNLGSLYFSGIGTDVDYPKAIHFFEEAARLGSSDAAVNLAIIYLGSDTNKSEEDFKKIHQLLEQAQSENSIAKYLLGYCYLKGFMVKQNQVKAFQLIKPLADEKYDEAQYILTDFYINGWGTTKNYNRAITSLQKAADQGNSAAIMRLADTLVEGKIYTKDIKKAHVLYNVASVMGEKGAAEKRDALESNLAIEDLLAVQAEAEDYKPEPSEKTTFIRQTFGGSLKAYIDSYIKPQKSKDTTPAK